MATYYSPIYKKLGNRLEELRKRKGMTQQAVAHEANISAANYWEIVHGKRNITLKTAAKLADALKVKLSELFDF
jgi:transcriptional regulator with XRE-family HTH domain